MAQSKIVELEVELRDAKNSLKSYEAFSSETSQKEENSCEKIKELTAKHKEADTRAEYAERSVQKLLKEVGRLEDELYIEKEHNKKLKEDMEAAFQDIENII